MTGVDATGRAPNDSGKAMLDYRVGRHVSFKRAMLTRLGGLPDVGSLSTRDDDDPVIALIDAWAAVLDNLAFYQERIANEGFLRTATERRSVLEMAREIGYELRPGVAASTWLSFETMAAPGGIDVFPIPIGTRAQSVPGPGELPQSFETVEPLEARPAWNSIPIVSAALSIPSPGDDEIALTGTDLVLQEGDPLLLLIHTSQPWWDVRRVRETRVEQAVLATPTDPIPLVPAHTVVTLDAALAKNTGSPNPASLVSSSQVHVLRTHASLFGYNAPLWDALPVSLRVGEIDPEFLAGGSNLNVRIAALDLINAQQSHVLHGAYRNRKESWAEAVFGSSVDTIDLDQVYPRVVRNSWVVLERDGATAVRRVKSVREIPRADFGISARVSRLQLSSDVAGFAPRTTSVLAQSQRLSFAWRPLPDPLAGTDRLDLDRAVPELKPGRPIVIDGETVEGVPVSEPAVIDGIEVGTGLGPRLRLKRMLTGTYRHTSVRVLANVTAATHGESRAEILGSGDHRHPFQSFVLRQLPLTHVAAATPTGSRTTLALWVGGVRWQEVPSLYGQPSDARVYVTRRSDAGEVTVTFGDGITGARLPSGTDNVIATYRVGIGTAADLDAERISIPLSRPLGLQNVVNPVPAEGADDPEGLDRARTNAPVTVRTLGRIVSVADYEDAARSFAGIGKARADVVWDGERSLIHLTVAGPDGAAIGPSSPTRAALLDAIDAIRHSTTPVLVSSYEARPFALDARLLVAADRLAADVIAAVRATLVDRYSFARQDFARSVPHSEVVSVIQSVPGVVAVVVEALHFTTDLATTENVLGAFPARRIGTSTLPAQIVVIDPLAIHLAEVGTT